MTESGSRKTEKDSIIYRFNNYKNTRLNNIKMTKKVKFALGATLQFGLIASIGDFVGWPYMGYVLGISIASFILTLIFFIYDMSKD